MFNAVWLITLAEGLSDSERAAIVGGLGDAARGLSGAQRVLFVPTLPGVYNGGDVIWRSEFADEAAYRASLAGDVWQAGIAPVLADCRRIAAVDAAAYPSGLSGGRSPGRGVYRVALFCANRDPTALRLAQFRDETAAMPRHVRSIRRWQLSTVAAAEGARPWTHVWEQEYDDIAGLMGPYMMHPCHWGQVDRWFDPEFPEWLVDTHLCHTFAAVDSAVIGPG